MHKTGNVVGWKVDRGDRAALLERFAPHYPEAIADHVTLEDGAEQKPLPPAVEAKIIGRADDGNGVEAMVVALDGSTDRADGSTYHITWSLAPGRRAMESNDVIRDKGWESFDKPVPVTVIPARL